MKIFRVKNKRLVLFIFATMSLFSCGGGSDSDNIEPTPITSPAPIEVSGGTVSSPAQMDPNLAHTISSDDAQNYFKVNVDAGNRIVIWSQLNTYLDDTPFARCSAAPTGYHVGILLVGTTSSACANNYEHVFEDGGEAVFRLGYPNDNSGIFLYAIVGDEADEEILSATGSGGLPDRPRLINISGDNDINAVNLFNYYAYRGIVGETITINAYLNNNFGGTDASRCGSAINSQSFDNHYSYGIAINDRSYNCDDEISYTFEQDETINLHFKYIKNVFGYFTISTNQ